MKKLSFFLVLLCTLAISKAQSLDSKQTAAKTTTGVYARVEFSSPIYDIDEVLGSGGYSMAFHYAKAEIKFYSDASCTTPTTLPSDSYFALSEYYVGHNIAQELHSDGYVEYYSNELVSSGSSSFLIRDEYQFYYHNIEYSTVSPYPPISDDLESCTLQLTDTGLGGAFTVMPPIFTFSVTPYYYFQSAL
jgi:hypothetical protein